MIGICRTIAGQTVSVRTHNGPHLDEIAALWLAERFGTPAFLEQYLEGTGDNRALYLGVWDGRHFYDHTSPNHDGQRDCCCATLMAEALGLGDGGADLRRLLKYVKQHDRHGGDQPYEFPRLVKLINDQHPQEPERIIGWTFLVLDSALAEQREFTAAMEELKQQGKVTWVPIGDREQFSIVAIESNSRQIHKAARVLQYDVVVIRNPSGNVCILADKLRLQSLDLSLDYVAYLLRIQERRVGRQVSDSWQELSLNQLMAEGTIEAAPEWFYHEVAYQLLNGSHSNPNVPPTTIPLDDIVAIIDEGIQRSVSRRELRRRRESHRADQNGKRKPVIATVASSQ